MGKSLPVNMVPISNVTSAPVKKIKPLLPKNMQANVFTNLIEVKGSTIDEIAKLCGFDFEAVKCPLSFEDSLGKTQQVPDKVAISRKDTSKYLGTIGRERGIIQYTDSLRFTEEFVAQGDADYRHADITGYGRQAYVVMRATEEFEIVPGDPIECYFTVTASHDSTKSLMVIPSPMRKKTGGVFVHPAFKAIKLKYTKNIASRMIQARKSIAGIRQYFKEFEVSFRNLATISLDNGAGETYLKAVFPSSLENSTQAENRREKVKEILASDPSLKIPPCQNTLLGLYFATVTFVDHYLTVKNTKGRDEKTAQIESKLSIDGAGAKRKAEALAQAIKLTEKLGLV